VIGLWTGRAGHRAPPALRGALAQCAVNPYKYLRMTYEQASNWTSDGPLDNKETGLKRKAPLRELFLCAVENL